MPSATKPTGTVQVLAFLAAAACCLALAYHYFLSTDTAGAGPATGTGRPSPSGPAPDRGVPVSVIRARPGAYPARVEVFGQARALWQTTVRSQVSGRVDRVSPAFRKGHILDKGTLLVRINDSRYRASLARADQNLAAAGLDLLKEEQEAGQARKDWTASGIQGDPGSPLVLRAPQMELARKSLEAARANRASAAADLDDCRITVPYRSIVVERLVSLGDTVSAGDRIAVITGVDKMEVSLSLDGTQLELLGSNLSGVQVTLRDDASGADYHGSRLRDSRIIDPETRLHRVFCTVDRPLALTPPLLAGTFLTAVITGPPRENLLRLPVSALTRQGLVWTVDRENTLRAFPASALFYDTDHVYVRAPEALDYPVRVTAAPNAAFVTGMKVRPAEAGKGD